MRRIEIITPQNVPIQYQLANVRERALAFAFDLMILSFISLFLFLVLMIFTSDNDARLTAFYIGVFPVLTFYTLFCELVMNGQTPGKRVMRIRVIKLTGSNLTLSDYLLRWLFRWLDIWVSFGAVAALQVSSSVKGQRVGDVLADTSVVRQRADYVVSLKDLLSIKTKSGHDISYPLVNSLKEEEMLLVKQVIDRFRKFRNDSNKEILKETAKAVAERLGLQKYPGNAMEFLQEVLVEYVTVTRS